MIINVGDKYLIQVPRFLVKPYIIPAIGLVLRKTMNLNTVILEELAIPKDYAVYLEDDDLLDSGIEWHFAKKIFDKSIPVLKYSESMLFDLTELNIQYLVRKSIHEMRELDEETY